MYSFSQLACSGDLNRKKGVGEAFDFLLLFPFLLLILLSCLFPSLLFLSPFLVCKAWIQLLHGFWGSEFSASSFHSKCFAPWPVPSASFLSTSLGLLFLKKNIYSGSITEHSSTFEGEKMLSLISRVLLNLRHLESLLGPVLLGHLTVLYTS